MAKKKKASPLLGRWRITWMKQWNQDFVDEEEEQCRHGGEHP